jgi:hypothetical protein
MRLLLIAFFAAAGFGVGIATRPTLMGMPLPMDVLTSSHPMDAEFKAELIQHLATITGVGVALGGAVVLLMNWVQKQRG